MKNWPAIILVAAALTAAAGCGGESRSTTRVEPAPIAAASTGVSQVAVPQRVELSGSVEAERVAAVSSRVMAAVTAVHVNVGETVRSGQTLVEIDPETTQGQVMQAQGALAQAQAALTLAERNHERFKRLVEKGAASELEADVARMQLEQARGAVKQAEGAVGEASSVARESRVAAPFAGRVSARLVEVGDLAAPGRPLVMVESTRGRRLVLSVPESVGGRVRVGDALEVSLDSTPGLGGLTGEVVEMSPGADPMTHSFVIKVRLDGADVPSGVAGRAWLPAGMRDAIAVPAAAVLRHGGVEMVVVRDDDGRARSRVVTLGAPLGDGLVEVLAGLNGDERVLVGLSAIPPDGAPVEESGR